MHNNIVTEQLKPEGIRPAGRTSSLTGATTQAHHHQVNPDANSPNG